MQGIPPRPTRIWYTANSVQMQCKQQSMHQANHSTMQHFANFKHCELDRGCKTAPSKLVLMAAMGLTAKEATMLFYRAVMNASPDYKPRLVRGVISQSQN